MQSPQLEDGYTKIANELLEALASYRIPGEQMQCLFVILRKTYGYNKKEDIISMSQFHELTGLKKPSICRAINDLVDKNIISKNANGRIPSYRFNKRYKTWKALAKKLTINKSANLPLAKVRPTKEKNTKERKEKIYKKESGNGRFKKPSLEEINKYCLERNNGIDAELFFNFYEAKDWYIGKNRIKNWKACVHTWEKNRRNEEGTTQQAIQKPIGSKTFQHKSGKTCKNCGFFNRCKVPGSQNYCSIGINETNFYERGKDATY